MKQKVFRAESTEPSAADFLTVETCGLQFICTALRLMTPQIPCNAKNQAYFDDDSLFEIPKKFFKPCLSY